MWKRKRQFQQNMGAAPAKQSVTHPIGCISGGSVNVHRVLWNGTTLNKKKNEEILLFDV
jgi:hypothetical protein